MTSSGTRPSRVSSTCRRPWAWASPVRATHSAAVAKAARCPASHAFMPSPMAKWACLFPEGPGRPRCPGHDEVQGAEVGDHVPFEAALVVEVEIVAPGAGGLPAHRASAAGAQSTHTGTRQESS